MSGTKMTLAVAAVASLLWGTREAAANNIAVTNVTLWNQNVAGQYAYADFTVSWDNSFRDDETWDAAWLFVKFRAPGSNNWEHAKLSTTSSDHLAPAGSTITAASDGTGVFLYRSAPGTGTVSYAHTRLRWNYGANGYNFPKGATLDIAVRAIEMVYCPTGAFYLGSTGTEAGHFYQYSDGVQTTNAYLVSSESAITVGQANGNLYYSSAGDQAGPIPAAYPKGYNAFYCMKYEMSQGQYADFLNKLTGLQWTNRSGTIIGVYNTQRRVIHGTFGSTVADAPDRACMDISYADNCAYLAWAGLRPMTELEFEKACRGPAVPVANEYAWGTTSYTVISGVVGTDGSGTETPSTAANCANGVYRCGIFAKPGSTRAQAGAGYYGAMELSGSAWERCITAGTTTGRAFTGTHGSGTLNADGSAANTDWGGVGLRGEGAGDVGRGGMPTSSRQVAASGGSPWWGNGYIGRGVRTAP